MAPFARIMNRLSEQFLAGAAFAGNQHCRVSLGSPQCNHLQPLDFFARANDAVNRIFATLHFAQFFFVIIQFRLERSQFAGQNPQIFDIAENHLANRAGNSPIFDDGDPGHDRIVFADFLHITNFRLAGLRYNMHPGILNHIRDMFADRLFGINIQKFTVSLIHHCNNAIFIHYDNAIKDAVDDGIQCAFKILDFFQFRSYFLQFGYILKNRHRPDNLIILDDW